ncbi:hypothetical protein [Parvularcula marina]|uniref:Uncharacterized protein n=1 Tax=Parvularcula marina TaxID=2292771 RepID=A0A371RHU7_9PROT|nr:hypothetical protein [Parvularcula marina]RFB05013.1 hypothetical protein DX908_06740 [Parvularcula marina]
MPIYNVDNPAAEDGWNVVVGPPGAPGARPKAVLNPAPNSITVAMGAQANSAMGAGAGAAQGFDTLYLTNCSAFCMLWRPARHANFTVGSMIHMNGGPDPGAVGWAAMMAGMAAGGDYFGILANSQPTVLSGGFVAAALAATPIPAANMWVYDANIDAINFAIDRSGNAGQFYE